jgi:hypothetical protein
VTLQKKFSHSSLVIYFFLTLPIKLKLGLQIGGRLLTATHLNQSNYLANQEQVLGLAAPFTSLCSKMLGRNHFADARQHVLTFAQPIFFCRVELLLDINLGTICADQLKCTYGMNKDLSASSRKGSGLKILQSLCLYYPLSLDLPASSSAAGALSEVFFLSDES